MPGADIQSNLQARVNPELSRVIPTSHLWIDTQRKPKQITLANLGSCMLPSHTHILHSCIPKILLSGFVFSRSISGWMCNCALALNNDLAKLTRNQTHSKFTILSQICYLHSTAFQNPTSFQLCRTKNWKYGNRASLARAASVISKLLVDNAALRGLCAQFNSTSGIIRANSRTLWVCWVGNLVRDWTWATLASSVSLPSFFLTSSSSGS